MIYNRASAWWQKKIVLWKKSHFLKETYIVDATGVLYNKTCRRLVVIYTLFLTSWNVRSEMEIITINSFFDHTKQLQVQGSNWMKESSSLSKRVVDLLLPPDLWEWVDPLEYDDLKRRRPRKLSSTSCQIGMEEINVREQKEKQAIGHSQLGQVLVLSQEAIEVLRK